MYHCCQLCLTIFDAFGNIIREFEGDKLIEIDIRYQENIEIEISNNKIEVKTEPKPKRVERILPVTGY